MSKQRGNIQTRFLAGYGKLRAEFRKYSSIALLNQIVSYLYRDFELKKHEQLGKMPWAQLVLIKWIIIDPDFGASKRIPTRDQTMKVMDMAYKLQNKTRLPSNYPSLMLFMRSIAYQQFSYQKDIALTELARQKILFTDLPEDHPLLSLFLDRFGLSANDCLELSLALIVRYMKNPPSTFNQGYFGILEKKYTEKTIRSFLQLISNDMDGVKTFLVSRSPPTRLPEEYYEESPFNQLPLVFINQSYVCWYPTALFRCLETLIFDKLRALNAQHFMVQFGAIFEEYVKRSIKESGSMYVSEKEIKPLIGDAKCVDFVITEADSIIFVDAKGVEMPAEARATHDPDVIKQRTNHTIIKAIEQAYSTLSHIEKLEAVIDSVHFKKMPYIIVVTYKEHYLGNGIRFSESIAEEKIAEIKARYPCDIPLENMFFVNIEEFDALCDAKRLGKTTFGDAFFKAKEADKDPMEKKFTFAMHLQEAGFVSTPKWLRLAVEEMTNKLTVFLESEKQ